MKFTEYLSEKSASGPKIKFGRPKSYIKDTCLHCKKITKHKISHGQDSHGKTTAHTCTECGFQKLY